MSITVTVPEKMRERELSLVGMEKGADVVERVWLGFAFGFRWNRRPLGLPQQRRTFRRPPFRALLTAPVAAAILALTLLLIVPSAARASGVETGPQGIAVDSSGEVYVSDWARNTIDEITPQGWSVIAGIPGQYGSPTPGSAIDSELDYPIGLAASKAGDLYIVDFGNCVVEKVTTAGTLSIIAGEVGQCGTPTPGPATSSMLASPIGVAVDSNGNLYIADQGTENGANNVIEKVTPSGTLSIFAGELGASGGPTPGPAIDSMLSYPQAVAVDSAGNVYIADSDNGVVEKVNAEGILSIYAGEFNSPDGVATDSAGDVYVTDTGNNEIEKVDTAGQLSVIAGNGQVGVPTPGLATDSKLDLPIDTAVDSDGSVYIADSGNDLVEKVTPSGDLSIIWSANFRLQVSKSGSGNGTVTSTPAGINCGSGPECEHEFEEGEEVTLNQAAAGGSEFKGWSGACSGTGECKVTMSAARSVSATFNSSPKPNFKLTVSKNGTGSGTVTSTPAGINCGVQCQANFEYGIPVSLKGVPGANTQSALWSGCESVDAFNECKGTMSAVKEVTATFYLEQHQLTVTKNGSGKGTVTSTPAGINCGVQCQANFEYGTPVTLVATPIGSGSSFAGWSGADCSGTGSCAAPMNAPQSVAATFSLTPHCVVPKLKGITLKAAKNALLKTNCKLGKVKGKKRPSARVKAQKPPPDTVATAGSKVYITVK